MEWLLKLLVDRFTLVTDNAFFFLHSLQESNKWLISGIVWLAFAEYIAQIYPAHSVRTDGVSVPSKGWNPEPCHGDLSHLVMKYNSVVFMISISVIVIHFPQRRLHWHKSWYVQLDYSWMTRTDMDLDQMDTNNLSSGAHKAQMGTMLSILAT